MQLRKVVIENFRGLSKIEVELDQTTVIIGENNSGKTSFLEAIRMCLGRTLSRRGGGFEDYDHHLPNNAAQPGEAGTLSITLDFAEDKTNEWPDEIVQAIPDIVVLHAGDIRHVTFRVTSQYDRAISDFVTDWEFLDAAGNGLGPKSRAPQVMATLQRICPAFYLSALRDAAREFSSRSSFWAPFLRNPSIDPQLRKQIEEELSDLNTRIIDAHANLQKVKANMAKTQELVALGAVDPVSIEALPGRISDMLSRTQINMKTTTGASIPLGRHGAGAQSLSVMFLFEAFLETMLADVYDKLSEPILALEEPEAHLHPSAIRQLWSVLATMKGQKIIATHSGDLLSEVPLLAIRRFCRANGRIEVYRVGKTTLSDDDLRKIGYHIQRSKGEMFFARCWLLVEGETDYWVLKRVAAILGVDLENHGVRILPFSQVGAATFAKIANDLHIGWFCMTDGDNAGQGYRRSLLPHLAGRVEQDCMALLPTKTVEILLCQNGYGQPYLNHISPQKKGRLTAKPTDLDYWEQVVDCRDSTPKEQLALEAVELIAQGGKNAVPKELQQIIEQAVKIGSS